MELRITHRGRDAGRRLAEAVTREGAMRLTLSSGAYAAVGLTIDREIELVGAPGTTLVGPLIISGRAKVRLVGLFVDGGVRVERFGLLHMRSCHIGIGGAPAAITLAAGSETMLMASVIDGMSGLAIAVDGDASARIERCRISGGRAAIAYQQSARLALGENLLQGPMVRMTGPIAARAVR